jgi:hypothetical protein
MKEKGRNERINNEIKILPVIKRAVDQINIRLMIRLAIDMVKIVTSRSQTKVNGAILNK